MDSKLVLLNLYLIQDSDEDGHGLGEFLKIIYNDNNKAQRSKE